MNEQRPADPASVKASKKEERQVDRQQMADLRELLDSPLFRRFIYRLLGECKVRNSIWEPSAKIHYLAGRQDIGHWVQFQIESANIEAVFTMLREEQQRQEGDKDA